MQNLSCYIQKHQYLVLTKINVYTYAPVATGRPKAVVPSGRERNWFMLIPMSNRARASHWKKTRNQLHKIIITLFCREMFLSNQFKDSFYLHLIAKYVKTRPLKIYNWPELLKTGVSLLSLTRQQLPKPAVSQSMVKQQELNPNTHD